MGKNNSKLRKNHINCRDIAYQQGRHKYPNKRHLSAEGYSLLPSALRPRLLGKKCKKSSFRDIFRGKIRSNYPKFAKNTQFLAILVFFQIVAASTIFGYLCSNPVSATSLTLTIPSSFSLDITPSTNGTFVKSESKSINVKTDNSSGYTLSIKAKNSDNSNVLLNGSNKLNSISEQTSEDNFKSDAKFNNTWGYLPSKFNNEDNTNFLPGPTTEESLLETTEEANETGTDYNITLGAKIDNTISSGSYSNDFIIQASANIVSEPTTMQGFDNYCKYMKEHESLGLIDTRDNNQYTVAKLKDGKCWMTQNLRIQNIEISSEDSAMESGTFTIPASDLENFGTEQDTSYVYVDAENDDNGGYYSWHTATAGQSNVIPGGSVDSICPKGWHLPTKDEFSNLIANSNYDSDSIKAAPANFTTPGYVYNKKISSSGTYGYYWSSGNYNNSTSLSDMFMVYSSTTNPSLSSTWRENGYSIRCIAGDMELKDYSIKYDLNGGSGGPSSNPQTGKMVGSSGGIKLSSEIPTKSGYAFEGWCTFNPGTNKTCYGTSYYPGDTYSLSGNLNIVLYATWLEFPTAVDKGSLGSMQDFDCDSKLPDIHNYGTVIDSRDNNTYRVAKLMDARCWMVENLRIVGKTLTSEDSDVENDYKIGDGSTTSTLISPNEEYPGVYYTWSVATAGSSSQTTNKTGSTAPHSICSKGWRLPTGGSSGEFKIVSGEYNNSWLVLQNSPMPNFTLGGTVNNNTAKGALWHVGSQGEYPSSTRSFNRNSSIYYYSLNFTQEKVVYAGVNGSSKDRYGEGIAQNGVFVRCISKD